MEATIEGDHHLKFASDELSLDEGSDKEAVIFLITFWNLSVLLEIGKLSRKYEPRGSTNRYGCTHSKHLEKFQL